MPILTIQYKQFPGGNSLPGGSTTNATVNTQSNQNAPPLSQPDQNNPGKYLNYAFMFWNLTGAINSGIDSNSNVIIQIGSNSVTATAWYVQTGGSNSWTGVYTYAFSEGQNQILTDIPIASVNPAAAWVPGQNKVETEASSYPSGVDIYADGSIGTEDFDLWLTYHGGTIVGNKLHVNPNAAIWAAIAFYKVPEEPPPFDLKVVDDFAAWQEIKNKLLLVADPGPEDLIRIRKLLEKVRKQDVYGEEDELTRVVSEIDKMNKVQVRGNLAAIKAQQVRLEAAEELLEDVLKRIG